MVDLDRARRQAKELLKAAQVGDPDARARMGDAIPRLAVAQRVIAREAGAASWPALVRREERFREVTFEEVDWTRVRRVTAVPFLQELPQVVLLAEGRRFVQPSGPIGRSEDPLVESVLRLCLGQAGFRSQDAHVLALSRDGAHVVFWTEGRRYFGSRPHRTDASWWTGPAGDAVELLGERGDQALARLVEAADAARVALSEEQYWEDNLRMVSRGYVRATTPQGGSGFGGTDEEWREERSIICDAIDRDGTFLDVGCANGYLTECVVGWSAEHGLRIDGYGVDISPELVALAHRRQPEATDRFWVGNALTWVPPGGRRFDFVHTLLDLVPAPRRPELIAHLLEHVVAPGGRLIVSQYLSTDPGLAAAKVLERFGYEVAGTTRQSHRPGREVGNPSAWLVKPGTTPLDMS